MYDPITIKRQQKLNKELGTIEVPQAFLDKFPDMKRERAEKYFSTYVDAVFRVFVKRLAFTSDGETNVSFAKLFNACGTFNYSKVRYSIWNAFRDIYPFMVVVKLGSNLNSKTNYNEKNTRVKVVNERMLEMLMAEKSPQEVYDQLFTADDEDAATAAVHIDMDNLARFIGCTQYELEKAPAEATKLRSKLNSNLWQAQLIQKVGIVTEKKFGAAILPMIESPSSFGRTYYKGLNIQNVSKQVRSAVIGHHYQYDMNAAVFATKLYLYGVAKGGDNALVGSLDGTYTRQYLAEKNQIRNRLAKHCFEGVNLPWDSKVKAIKDALTAIGFGARMQGRTWMGKNGLEGTALADILKSPAVRVSFEQDAWVKAFAAEQIEIEDAILTHAETLDGFDDMVTAIRDINEVNGRVTRAGKLAYMYQHYETFIMDIAVGVMKRYRIEPVARIHDAFIVREKLPDRVLDDVYAEWGLRDYMRLDCDEVREWAEASYKRAIDDAAREQAEHHDRMKKAETLARMYAIKKAGVA